MCADNLSCSSSRVREVDRRLLEIVSATSSFVYRRHEAANPVAAPRWPSKAAADVSPYAAAVKAGSSSSPPASPAPASVDAAEVAALGPSRRFAVVVEAAGGFGADRRS